MRDAQGMPLAVGDVVQIDPTERFGACFLTITEVKSWGVQGFVQIPMQGRAYYRVAFDKIVHIGAAAWVPGDEAELEAPDPDRADATGEPLQSADAPGEPR